MSRWWRAYDDALHDPKVQSLPDDLFKRWFNLLCVASKYGGELPVEPLLKRLLNARSDHLKRHLEQLVKRGLLDEIDGRLVPHNWLKRQYKTDNSTERVRTHRQAKRNVSETENETPPEYRVQITEKNLLGDRVATRPKQSDQFEVFWKAYPRRQGANPKAPARKQFVALVRAGTNPEAIIEGARRCAETDADKIATPYIPQAVKWLRDRRWEDYAAVAESPSTPQPPRPGLPSHEEMLRRHAERNAPKGPSVLGQSASVREAAKTGGAVDLGPISDAGNGRVATLFPETRLGTVYAPSDTSGDSREHSSSNAMARVV